METDGGVEKQKQFFHTSVQNAWGVLQSSHRLGYPSNNKTGHFICYENRTFLFAIDSRWSSRWSLDVVGLWTVVGLWRRIGIPKPPFLNVGNFKDGIRAGR